MGGRFMISPPAISHSWCSSSSCAFDEVKERPPAPWHDRHCTRDLAIAWPADRQGAWATSFGKPAAPPVSTREHAVGIRPPRHAWRITVRRLPSLKQSLAGPADRWHRFTRDQRTAKRRRKVLPTSSRGSKRKLLFPHLMVRRGNQSEKRNKIR